MAPVDGRGRLDRRDRGEWSAVRSTQGPDDYDIISFGEYVPDTHVQVGEGCAQRVGRLLDLLNGLELIVADGLRGPRIVHLVDDRHVGSIPQFLDEPAD